MGKLVKRLKHWTLPVLGSAALTSASLFSLHEINPNPDRNIIMTRAESHILPEQPRGISAAELFAEREHLIEWAKALHLQGKLNAKSGAISELIARASTIQEALNENHTLNEYTKRLDANLAVFRAEREEYLDLESAFKKDPKTAVDLVAKRSLTGVEYIEAERSPFNLFRGIPIANCYGIWLKHLAVSPVDLKTEVYRAHVQAAHVFGKKVYNPYPQSGRRGDLHDTATLLIKGLEATQEKEVTTGEIGTDAFTLPLSRKVFTTKRNPVYSETLLGKASGEGVAGEVVNPTKFENQFTYPVLFYTHGDQTYKHVLTSETTEPTYQDNNGKVITAALPFTPLETIQEVSKLLENVNSHKQRLKKFKPGTLGHADELDNLESELTSARTALHYSFGDTILSKDEDTRTLRLTQVALLKKVEGELSLLPSLKIRHYKKTLESTPNNFSTIKSLKQLDPDAAKRYEEAYKKWADKTIDKLNKGEINTYNPGALGLEGVQSIDRITDPYVRAVYSQSEGRKSIPANIMNAARALLKAQRDYNQAKTQERYNLMTVSSLDAVEQSFKDIIMPSSIYFNRIKAKLLADIQKDKAKLKAK